MSTTHIEVDRVRNAHAGFYIDLRDELHSVETKRIGYTCSFHKYPVNFDRALSETINDVMEASFTSHVQHDSPLITSLPENGYSFDFEVQDFEAQLGYTTGTWTGSAHAEASIDLNVAVFDSDGVELTRTVISGDGSSIHSGGCSVGAKALAEAASEAIEEATQIFVYKVINSPRLDREDPDTDSIAADLGASK